MHHAADVVDEKSWTLSVSDVKKIYTVQFPTQTDCFLS